MLPAAFRLRQRSDFNATVRLGRRAARQRLVVHLRAPVTTETPASVEASTPVPARAGFVIGRTVGGAVVRNRVRRQLRHLTASRLGQLPAGSTLVVRALPAAAGSTAGELARDLDAGLDRCLGGAR